MRASVCLAAYTIVVAASQPASAKLEYSAFNATDGTRYLVVSGEFEANEPLDQFVAASTQNKAEVVTFDSAGGNVASAMKLGRTIRALGLNTIQIRQLNCSSACSLAFLGGVQRIAEPGSIGVHRSSFGPEFAIGRDEAVARVQEGTADIIAYLNEMGVDPNLLSFALRYDQTDIRYLSGSEMRDLRVTTADATGVDRPNAPTQPQQAPEVAADEQALEYAALTFVRRLVEEHGTDADTALTTVLNSYADTVSYYGKQTTLSAVVRDKRDYFLRWPERGYKIRDDSVMVTCANNSCMVSGVYDWVVRSLPRNRQAQGIARFSYTISTGQNPKVLSEAGEVLRR